MSRCKLCDDPRIQFHWHTGTVRIDVLPGADDDAVVVVEGRHVLTADQAREIVEKLGEAARVCDRANGVAW